MANKDNPHYETSSIQKISALLIPCFAYVAVLGVPMSFTGIIESFSVNAATATIATTAEISCIAIASLFISLALSYLNPRFTYVLGVLLAIGGQLGTILADDFIFAVVARGIAGVGEGLCIGIGFASLAQMTGGTRLLGISPGISAAVTLTAFLTVPALHEVLGSKSIFWLLLSGYALLLPLAFYLPNDKIERLIANESFTSAINLRSSSLFLLCLLTSMGANTLWLYFEQVGQNAGFDYAQIGVVGSVSMLCSVFVPFVASAVFSKIKNIIPLAAACLLMAVTSYLYVIPNDLIYWAIGISMTFLYVFVLAYARMYSSDFDSTGRATAAAIGADSLGMVIGPIIVAVTLQLDRDLGPLGQFGVLMQLLCIIPALLVLTKKKTTARLHNAEVASHKKGHSDLAVG